MWRSHWREIWGVLALNALACTVLFAGMFANNLLLMLAGVLGLVVTQFPVYGSIFRLAFGSDYPGDQRFALAHHGLQWRDIELKMLGSGALIFLFSAILALLMYVALLFGLGALIYAQGLPLPKLLQSDPFQAAGAQGLQLHSIGNAIMQLALAFVWVRLSLSYPATAVSGRVQVFRTWKLTRGHFWRLFLATMVLELPSALFVVLGNGAGLSMDGKPAPLEPGWTFFFSLACGGWAGAAAMPLAAGVQAYFYRNLKTAK